MDRPKRNKNRTWKREQDNSQNEQTMEQNKRQKIVKGRVEIPKNSRANIPSSHRTSIRGIGRGRATRGRSRGRERGEIIKIPGRNTPLHQLKNHRPSAPANTSQFIIAEHMPNQSPMPLPMQANQNIDGESLDTSGYGFELYNKLMDQDATNTSNIEEKKETLSITALREMSQEKLIELVIKQHRKIKKLEEECQNLGK